MTQEEKKEFIRLLCKLCNEEGWKTYIQSIRIPKDADNIELYESHDFDFGYKTRIILEPPYKNE